MTCRLSQVSSSAGLKAQVYPNPATDKITVSFNASKRTAYHLVMTDVIGQRVLNTDGSTTEGINIVELNLSTLAKGIYMLSIMSNGNTEQVRVIVE